MLQRLLEKFRASANTDYATPCYQSISQQARQPVFYQQAGYGLPDTRDGRLELLLLHLFIVLHARKGVAEERDFCQWLFDRAFIDLDQAFREMGVGDLGVGKKVQRLAEIFYGRITEYGQATEPAMLATCLQKNLSTLEDNRARQLAGYVLESCNIIRQQPFPEIQAGDLRFAAIPP